MSVLSEDNNTVPANSRPGDGHEESQYLTDRERYVIADKIGEDWSKLVEVIDFSESEKNDICKKDRTCDKAFEIIHHWRRIKGIDATKDAMKDILRQINRKDIIDIIDGVSSNQKCLEKFAERLKYNFKDFSIPQPPRCDKDLPIDEVFIDQQMAICYEQKNDEKIENEIIGIKQLFKNSSNEPLQRILVEGDPGFGKTTLAFKLVVDWAKGREYIASKFKIVMLILLRNIKGQTFEDAVRKTWKNEFDETLTDDRINTLFDKQNVLLILDGIDEMEEKDRAILMQILAKKKFCSACVLVTSRRGLFTVRRSLAPEYAMLMLDYSKLGEKCKFWDKRVYLKGLSNEQRDTCLKQNFKIDADAMSNVNQIFTGTTRDMFRCPLLVFWLGLILKTGSVENIHSKTSFYKVLLNLIFDKTLIREHATEEVDAEFDLFSSSCDRSLKQQVIQFGNFCLDHLLRHSLYFTQKELSSFSEGILLRSDVFIKSKSLIKDEEVISYQPLHKSLLEFMAAFAFSNSSGPFDHKMFGCKIKELIEKGLFPTETNLFFMFLGGLMDQDAHFLFKALSPWSAVYHIGTPGIINIVAELTEIKDNFIDQISGFFPQCYEIDQSDRIPPNYYSSPHHERLLEVYLKNTTSPFPSIKWNLKVPLQMPNLQLKCKQLVITLSSNCIADSNVINSVDCDELNWICAKKIDDSIWDTFCSLMLPINAKRHHLYLRGCDSSTCTMILNDVKEGRLKELSFQRIRFFDCPFTDIEVDIITELIEANRLTTGLVFSFTEEHHHYCPATMLHRLWNATIKSTSIKEFFFSDINCKMKSVFVSHCTPGENRRTSFSYLGLEGDFETQLLYDFQDSIDELRLRTFSKKSDPLHFLNKFKTVNYLECPSQLLASVQLEKFPVLSSLKELNLIIEAECDIPSLVCNLTSLQSLILYLGKLPPDLEKLPDSLKDFLSSVLKLPNLRNLGLYVIPSDKILSHLAKHLLDILPAHLMSLEFFVNSNESDPKSIVEAMKPLKELLLKRQRLRKLGIINHYNSDPVLYQLPSLFTSYDFEFVYELDGDKDDHSVNRQINFKKWLVSAGRLIIKLKDQDVARFSIFNLRTLTNVMNYCDIL